MTEKKVILAKKEYDDMEAELKDLRAVVTSRTVVQILEESLKWNVVYNTASGTRIKYILGTDSDEEKMKVLADVHYDNLGTCIWNREKDGGNQMIADIRGWGAIQNEFKTNEEAEKFQDEVGEFITQAIKEKLAKLPQQEISDEEIEKATNNPNNDGYSFREGAKWYREQLKK